MLELMQLQLVEALGSASVDLDRVNTALCGAPAQQTLSWVSETFGSDVVMTSSFGAESAVMLHLISQYLPATRVIFVDTGYLFAETYRFAEALTARFELDVRVYSPLMSSARQEALFGKRWEGDEDQVREYQRSNKVEPLDRALRELAPKAWLSGVRKHQTDFRSNLRPVELHGAIYKVHPILDWSQEAVASYMLEHDLPYHPLVAKHYLSIGDEHSTLAVRPGMDARSGRNLGTHKECGIHLPRTPEERSFKSSGL